MKNIISNEQRRFNALSSEIDNLYHEAASLLGLSDTAMYLLYSLEEHGDGIAQRDICLLYGFSRQSINSAVSTLVRDGVVELRKGEGRERSIFLTEKGRKLVAERIVPLIALEKSIVSDWSKEEWNMLLNLLQRYRDSFRTHLPRLEGISKGRVA